MKTMDEKINKDAEALANDIRRVRNDLADLLWSGRRRAKKRTAERRSEARKVAADPAGSSPGAAVYVEEPGQEEKVVVKRAPAWARVLAVVLALGTAAAVLRMRRSKVIVSYRRRPRFRRMATRTVIQEPAAEETPFAGRTETLSQEESKAEGLPLL
ncbi:MAG: hypothetical protein M1376_07540 [Planctomycetes bacterium]|nr:hypothetical protein [Planctomycetota bacterium]